MSKTLSFIAAFLFFCASQGNAQTPNYPHHHYPYPGKGGYPAGSNTSNNFAPGEGGGTSNSTGQSGTGANIDVVYHRINWTVDPRTATNIITGTVVTYFKTLVANVSTISMDLNSTSFSSGTTVTYHGTGCSKTLASNILTITLPSTIAAINTLDSFTISYSGVPPGVVGAAQGYQQGGSGATKYTSSLSESYEDRDWWPCKADMKDKIDSMDINVTVPWETATNDTFWVACNGVLYDSTISGLTRTFKYKTRYPIASYLVALSVAKFKKFYRTVNVSGTNVPVAYYLLSSNTTTTNNNAVASMDKINTVLQAFSAKFGDYPFKLEKHGFYDGLMGAGGMEHQTFSGIAGGTTLADIPTLAHELMHQWFGDNVTFATWNDLWLAEGFARYSEVLAPQLVSGLGYSSLSTLSSYRTTALGLAGSAWIPNSNMSNSALVWGNPYGSTVYEKGCMVVSMLRALSGDTKFYQALTNYQTNLKGKSATTDSLRNYFNAVLGTDISSFFNDYVGGSGPGTTAVGGQGYPTDTIYWNTPTTNRLVLSVGVQTRTSANVTYFRGPVVVHATNAASGWTKDTTIVMYDWGSGNLSYAGNGLSAPFAGNVLNFDLSFNPTNLFYDDSLVTMTKGGTRKVATLTGYTWNGGTSAAWNTTTNWASGTVPPSGAQVTIATTVNQPMLPGTITVGTLTLNAGTKLNIGNNNLIINGAVTGTGTITGGTTSSITINGTAGTLNFDQTSATTRSLNNLTVNAGGSATLGSALDVYGTIALTSGSLDLAGKNLTLKSTISGTARIADLTGSTLSNATNVTVERYLSDVGRRAWRLLSVPVTGSQTIKQAWQENGVTAANLGTNITSPLYTGANGFDAGSNSSSILTHVQGGVSGPSWNGSLANTSTTLLSAFPGYMIFVRGDRFATSGNALHAPTVLRATGTIRQGTQSAVTVSATGTGYTLVGNPYPSPIDFETIAGTANLAQSYYLWDPTLTGNNGVGGYRLVQRTAPNTYQQTPVVLGGPVVDPTIRYIHSGQAFFLKATGANANVVFTESSKAASLSIVNPIVNTAGDQQLVVNLMQADAVNGPTLLDGLRVRYADTYQADISDDILKIGNFGENISSLREGRSIIVENRPMIGIHDTIYLRMTNTGVKNYSFQVGTIDFVQPNLKAYLQDDYQGTNTLLDLTGNINNVDFSVTADPASAASNRFKIVFSNNLALPVNFTSIKAYQANTAIAVEWKVSNQLNIQQYEIERSADGSAFSKMATQAVNMTSGSDAAYSWLDLNPLTGDNFYRIRSVGNSGDIKYSPVVNVKIGKEKAAINVYPNPVANRILNLQFTDMEKGIYSIRLLNTMGQVVFTQQLTHNGGSAAQSISLGKSMAGGSYRLEIIQPDNSRTAKTVSILE